MIASHVDDVWCRLEQTFRLMETKQTEEQVRGTEHMMRVNINYEQFNISIKAGSWRQLSG
jgi:hypothetical protein